VDREALEELQSRLYCLQAALEDVDRDLAASLEPADVAEALSWLAENARPLATTWIEPRTSHDTPHDTPHNTPQDTPHDTPDGQCR
jgi:hypothetical protein